MNKATTIMILLLSVISFSAQAQNSGDLYQTQQKTKITLQNEVDILELQLKKAELVGVGGQITNLPTLSGIVTGESGNLVAEFRQGNAVIRVERGDLLNGFWRVEEIGVTGVTLRSKDGGQARTVSFGTPDRPTNAYLGGGIPSVMRAAVVPEQIGR